MGFSQLRVGPNKPSIYGILQPVSDAIKLFSKEIIVNTSSHKLLFYFRPAIGLLIVLSVWETMTMLCPRRGFTLTIIIIAMFLGLNSYPLIFSGWSSTRKYSLLGGIRGVSQSISYEISLVFLFIVIMVFYNSASLIVITIHSYYFFLILVTPVVLFFLFLSIVAERNRTPFDFSEGERELVSGFNTEYRRGGFAIIFMAEYGIIYFLSSLLVWRAFSDIGNLFYFLTSCIVFLWVWLRRTYPRYRYDLLINLAWKTILPASLIFLVVSLCVTNYIKISKN